MPAAAFQLCSSKALKAAGSGDAGRVIAASVNEFRSCGRRLPRAPRHSAPVRVSRLRGSRSPALIAARMITIAVPRETTPGETRVALIPQSVAPLVKAGHTVRVQSTAGEAAGFTDADYRDAGAMVV